MENLPHSGTGEIAEECEKFQTEEKRRRMKSNARGRGVYISAAVTRMSFGGDE